MYNSECIHKICKYLCTFYRTITISHKCCVKVYSELVKSPEHLQLFIISL